MDLTTIPFRATSHTGISIHVYDRDPDTGRAAVLIRMKAGCAYPHHRHRGTEEILILQGGYRDQHGTYRAGDFTRYEDGSEHHPIALEGEEDCVLFAITEHGIDVL